MFEAEVVGSQLILEIKISACLAFAFYFNLFIVYESYANPTQKKKNPSLLFHLEFSVKVLVKKNCLSRKRNHFYQ